MWKLHFSHTLPFLRSRDILVKGRKHLYVCYAALRQPPYYRVVRYDEVVFVIQSCVLLITNSCKIISSTLTCMRGHYYHVSSILLLSLICGPLDAMLAVRCTSLSPHKQSVVLSRYLKIPSSKSSHEIDHIY